MALTNYQVVPAIAAGRDAKNGTGSFWGSGSPSRWTRANRGYIPRRVAESLDAVAERHGGIEAIVMSYATPIAVKIAGVWLRPDVRYSTTTSTQHAPYLGQLGCRWLPRDASAQDVEDVIAGYVEYDPADGKMHRGPVSRLVHRVRMNGRPVSQFNCEDAAHRLADALAETHPDRRVTVRTEEVAA